MFPGLDGSAQSYNGHPRVSGDVSGGEVSQSMFARSSPRERGCFHGIGGITSASAVIPA